jgi:RNA polymerase sigma-70 factor (ECF subfamily)
LERVPVNGQPGALLVDAEGGVMTVIALDVLDGAVQAVRAVVNPDKLRHLGRLSSPEHPLRRVGAGRAGRGSA